MSEWRTPGPCLPFSLSFPTCLETQEAARSGALGGRGPGKSWFLSLEDPVWALAWEAGAVKSGSWGAGSVAGGSLAPGPAWGATLLWVFPSP